MRGAGQEEDRGPAVEEMQAPHHRRGGWPEIELNVWTIGINCLSQVSMVDGNYFKKLEAVAKAVRGNDRPFGGIQLIMTGRWRSHRKLKHFNSDGAMSSWTFVSSSV